eukprot:TRINITY_DN1561_c0_g2_i1.p1 TRINITY_DN1561_c0_g2~~TRINITY_DN1561_c0_g2_i1.p1  ORF type:complete len:942 (-),score=373.42 TRINITY_DN1561_c0_g2_i1:274-2820(-)
MVQATAANAPFKVVQRGKSDEIGIQVMYNDEQTVLTPEQAMATMLANLAQIVEASEDGQYKVKDFVMSCPGYFNDSQRHALVDAAKIADLNCVALVNDLSAAALGYGFYRRKNFVAGEEKFVLFADFGHSHFSASVIGFSDKIRVVSSEHLCNVGSEDIDRALSFLLAQKFKESTGLDCTGNPKAMLKLRTVAENTKKRFSPEGVTSIPVNVECLYQDRDLFAHVNIEEFDNIVSPIAGQIAQKFKESTGLDCTGNPKAMLKLRTVAENTKKRFSPEGVTSIPVNVECLYQDRDLFAHVNIEEFDNIVSPIAGQIAQPLESLVNSFTQLCPGANLDSVELVGGGIRTRMIKMVLAASCGLDSAEALSTSLNFDECIAKGLTLKAAFMSPTCQAVSFPLHDSLYFPITVQVSGEDFAGISLDKTTQTYTRGTKIPFVERKELTITKPFIVNAFQNGETPIGSYEMSVLPKSAGPHKITVILTINEFGLFSVSSAFATIEKLVPVEKKKVKKTTKKDDKKKTKKDDKKTEEKKDSDEKKVEEPMDVDENTEKKESTEEKEEIVEEEVEEPPRKKFVHENLQMNSQCLGFSKTMLDRLFESEVSMANQDRLIRETQAKRNELESYIYDMRDKTSDYGILKDFCTETEKEKFSKLLNEMEDWLYSDEGFNGSKKEFVAQLDKLQGYGNPIVFRASEVNGRDSAVRMFNNVIQIYQGVAGSMDKKYDHFTDEDRSKLNDTCKTAMSWLSERLMKMPSSLSEDPSVTIKEIEAKAREVEATCKPIANKPKPAPKKEEKKKDEKKEGEEDKKTEGEETPKKAEEDMDVDASSPKAEGEEEMPSLEKTSTEAPMDV